MNKILIITMRELRSYFSTWLGYIVISAALLLNGILFNTFAMGDAPKFSSDVLKDFFYFSSGIAMVSCMLLAMRLIAEENEFAWGVSPRDCPLCLGPGSHSNARRDQCSGSYGRDAGALAPVLEGGHTLQGSAGVWGDS
ncbi:MAG: hypothetical protein EOP07_06165 [Proteobacteria bacterium]|nr:MAG: hypothetical protein EOP07_06165 [Pseudomonadota bacterium]